MNIKNTKIIDFAGMGFKTERQPSQRLRGRRGQRRNSNYVAKNSRGVFAQLFGA